MILNKGRETNSNTTFLKNFEEESRNNENDSVVSIAALAVSAIALTGVAPSKQLRIKNFKYDAMRRKFYYGSCLRSDQKYTCLKEFLYKP